MYNIISLHVVALLDSSLHVVGAQPDKTIHQSQQLDMLDGHK